MTKLAAKILFLSVLIVAGAFGVDYLRRHSAETQKLIELEDKNRQLQLVVERLTSENRVAQLLVTDQKTVAGKVKTTLLFVEYDRAGKPLPAKSVTIDGAEAHLDALVVKFDHYLVENNDALRGHSLALFTRIFGNEQTPDSAAQLDRPNQIPDFYQGVDARTGPFERQLWADFWTLARDSELAKSQGVRVANGDGKFWPCEKNQLYTLRIESDGGLNLAVEPVTGLFLEALKKADAR